LLGQVATTSYSYEDGQRDNVLATSGDSTRVITVTHGDYDGTQRLMFRSLP
jgi:hypothetical protein